MTTYETKLKLKLDDVLIITKKDHVGNGFLQQTVDNQYEVTIRDLIAEVKRLLEESKTKAKHSSSKDKSRTIFGVTKDGKVSVTHFD